MKVKDLEKQYKEFSLKRKDKIKEEPSRFKRFWKWVWYLLSTPFIWLWYNIRDWRTLVIFVLTVAVVSCEVWVPYLIWFITGSVWWLGIGSACWLFWLGPGTPFLPLCIAITIGIKALIGKLHR